jgi:3-hydroxybutyryl-CoA dehydratase
VSSEPETPALTIGLTETHTRTVTETDVRHFADITGDHSAIHVDEAFAASTRFKTRIAHGALLVGYVSTAVALMNNHLPPPGGVSSSYSVRFLRPARLGDTITTRLTVTEMIPTEGRIVFETACMNQNDEKVLDGTVVMKILQDRL